jgi:hypothetical protein
MPLTLATLDMLTETIEKLSPRGIYPLDGDGDRIDLMMRDAIEAGEEPCHTLSDLLRGYADAFELESYP